MAGGAGVPDYYAVLGVSRGASAAEVRAAYLKLALKWHPDKQGREDTEEATAARFQEIQQAYKVLSDPSKRAMYDVGTYDPALDADDDVNLMNDLLGQMVATMDKEKEDDDSVAKMEALWGMIAEIDLSFDDHQDEKKKGRASTSTSSSSSSSPSSSSSSSSSSDDPRLLRINITLVGTSRSARVAGRRGAGPSSYRRRAFGHGKGGGGCA